MALAGMQDALSGEQSEPIGSMDLSIGPSMFETIGRPPTGAPSAEEMAKQMEDLRRNRRVVVKGVHAITYDLRKLEDQTKYTTDLGALLSGVAMKTHAVLCKTPPQFVNDANGAGYIVHMEWIEFALIDEPAPTTGDGHGDQSRNATGRG